MAGVELATAYVSLVVEGSKVAPGVKQALSSSETEASRSGLRSGKRFTSGFGSSLKGVGSALLGAFAVTKGIDFLKSTIAEATEASVVTKRTASVIKSMGNASKISAKEVASLAGSISNKVGIDDEAIQSGENLLLTFGHIRNEAGKGNDVFSQTTGLMVDMSVAMGQDMKSSAIQLGKALNDPIKGVTALQRVGVAFTQEQKDQIKHLVDTNQTLKAQKIILGEVKKEFGGAGKAMSTPAMRAETAWNNLKEQIGTQLLPTVTRFEVWLSKKAIPTVSHFFDQMKRGKGAGGQLADTLRDVRDVAGKAAEKVGDIISAFNGMPGWTKKLLIGGGAAAVVGKKLGLGSLVSGAGKSLLTSGVQKTFETNPAALGGGKGGGIPGAVKTGAAAGGGAAAGATGTAVFLGLAAVLGPAVGAFLIPKLLHGKNQDNAMAGAAVAESTGGQGGMALPPDVGKALVSDSSGKPLNIFPKDFIANLTTGVIKVKDMKDTLAGLGLLTPGIRKQLDGLGKTKVEPKIGADSKPLEGRYHQSKALLADLGHAKPKPVVDADNHPATMKVKDILHSLGIVDKQHPTPKVSTTGVPQAIQGVNQLLHSMGLLHDKSITITTHYNKQFGGLAGGGGHEAPRRAHGGPITPGLAYMVGETQPELFISSERGRIDAHPSASTLAQGSPAPGGLSDRDIERLAKAIGSQVYAGANDAQMGLNRRVTVAMRS